MKFLALIWIMGGCCLVHAEDDPVVNTKYGPVVGSTVLFPDAPGPFKSVRRFLGIPFASPPVGDLRFRAPEPPKEWTTPPGQKWGNICPQYHGNGTTKLVKMYWPSFTVENFSEDCLYLNVFSPDTPDKSSSLLPVMVYIHGGVYIFGAAVFYPGDQIASHGVVVVTIQYRLGPLGFASTGDSAAPGICTKMNLQFSL